MPGNRLLAFGTIGVVLSALCCFTPILVVLLGAVGLSAFIGYLDYVLLPSVLIFIGIVAYALVSKRHK